MTVLPVTNRKRKVTRAKARRKVLRLWKELIFRVAQPGRDSTDIVFIVGCQRSGTTLLNRIFEEDWSTKVYPEVSELSRRDRPDHLRLDPLPEVKAKLSSVRAPLIVLKPLVESQRTPELLNYFSGSKAIWMYRNHRAVARSRVKRKGPENSIRDLRSIVQGASDDWRNENVSDEVRDIVLRNFAEDMNGMDAAALYWYVRNQLFFDLDLFKDPRVILCQYEALVQDPLAAMKHIYAALGHDFPGDGIIKEVHAESLQKGRDLSLSPPIESICRSLQARLDGMWLERFTESEYSTWGASQ